MGRKHRQTIKNSPVQIYISAIIIGNTATEFFLCSAIRIFPFRIYNRFFLCAFCRK